jgi:hypothetical protein
MGEEREELIQAMSYAAHQEAHKHLSEAGRKVLEMMEYTSRKLGASYYRCLCGGQRHRKPLRARQRRHQGISRTADVDLEAFSEEAAGEE